MNEDNRGVKQCARHPSQLFTGFCSLCLVERLSDINLHKQNSEVLQPVESEIVEMPSEVNPVEVVRVRNTLQVLLQLDDVNGVDVEKYRTSDHRGILNKSLVERGSACASYHHECLNTENLEVGSSSESRAVERSDSTAGEILENGKNSGFLDDEMLSKRLFSSVFSKKKLKWRSMSVTRREDTPDRCKSCSRLEVEQLEGTPNMRHSCDWRLCQDSRKCFSDPPRHSWDGSMVGKAFACSFACLEEREDNSRKIKRCSPGLPATQAPNRNGSSSAREQTGPFSFCNGEPLSSEGGLSEKSAERNQQESVLGSSILKVRGKNDGRWSKVWDWNITSPFRDLLKKREHNSKMSLPETGKKGRNGRSTENTGLETGRRISNGKVYSTTTSQLKNQNISTYYTTKNLRPEWKNKRDFPQTRNRSVQFSSPGNFDHGLLRFYLTPLRSSRRCTSKDRGKSTRSFTKGIFRFQ